MGVEVRVTLGVGVGWGNNIDFLLTKFHPVLAVFAVDFIYKYAPESSLLKRPISLNTLR